MAKYLICYLFALNLLSTKMFSFSCVFATFFDFIFCFFLCPGMIRTSVLMCTVTETMKRPDFSERNLPSSKSTSPFFPKLCWKEIQCPMDIKLLSADLCWASDWDWAGSVWWWNQINFTESRLSTNMGDWDTFRTACDTLCIILYKTISKKRDDNMIEETQVTMYVAPCSRVQVLFCRPFPSSCRAWGSSWRQNHPTFSAPQKYLLALLETLMRNMVCSL